jgi:pilus assembly protein CpaB
MNYETRKNMWLIILALGFALIAAFLATYWMKSRVDAVEASKAALANVVVLARDIPMGKRLELADLRMVRTTANSMPEDAFQSEAAVVGQVARSPFLAGEVLIERRLSKYLGGSALASVLTPGMRAVTVRVDDVIGVGGFVLPENRVDVISAFRDRDDHKAETILGDVRVLAVDQRSDSGTDAPLLVRAVTLEVTPEGAEKIAAAKQRGSIQLTLRNPLPTPEETPTEPLQLVQMPLAAPAPATANPLRVAQKPTPSAPPAITLIRGTQLSVRIL